MDKVLAKQAVFLGNPEKVESVGKKQDESNNDYYQQGRIHICTLLSCRLFLGEKNIAFSKRFQKVS